MLSTSSVYDFAMLGLIDQVKMYLDSGFDINTQNDAGNTIAHIAVANGHQEILQLCLNSGYDVNIKNENGNTIDDMPKVN